MFLSHFIGNNPLELFPYSCAIPVSGSALTTCQTIRWISRANLLEDTVNK
jgi:hypothetical protein